MIVIVLAMTHFLIIISRKKINFIYDLSRTSHKSQMYIVSMIKDS